MVRIGPKIYRTIFFYAVTNEVLTNPNILEKFNKHSEYHQSGSTTPSPSSPVMTISAIMNATNKVDSPCSTTTT